MEHIPAREARIFWTPNGDVEVHRVGSGIHPRHHRSSGGACWGFWQEASPEELYYRLLQQVCHLIINHGIEPAKVHEAFKVVPEYRLAWPPDHPDFLSEDEGDAVERPLPKFSPGYNVFD
jgi:hypothetical protein